MKTCLYRLYRLLPRAADCHVKNEDSKRSVCLQETRYDRSFSFPAVYHGVSNKSAGTHWQRVTHTLNLSLPRTVQRDRGIIKL